MNRIAILTPYMTTGDAVCNDVSGMYEVLKRLDFDARIYAADWTPKEPNRQSHRSKPLPLEPNVWSVSTIDSFLTDASDLLIYHYSMGWDQGLDLLRELKCKRVIKYHNVTPPEFFTGWSATYEGVCRAGREQLEALACTECDVYLSDSEYNMWELISKGADPANSFVVPPFHLIDYLQSLEPNFEVLDKYRNGTTNILMVGRVSPNKGHVGLIDAFGTYHRYFNNKSRLLIVGKEPDELKSYSIFLRETVARLGLQDAVVFTGEVNAAALKSYYLLAKAFLITSQHEGFCVPLVEAMAMKVPIVAYASSAIADTAGEAGLVWEEGNPALLAKSIDVIVNEEPVGAKLGLLGTRRYEQLFANQKIEAQFLSALSGVL